MARQLLMLIAKKYYGWTLEKVWDYFGWKNHASVIYAINNIEKKLKSNKELAHDYNVFVERVEQ
jgi:chromosomal replication initiation ATPase DnaA